MILIFFMLFLSNFIYASQEQKQFDRAWCITQNEIALSSSQKAKQRDLSKYLRAAKHDARWQTVKDLPGPLKENFFNLVRNIAVNNPQDYRFMRNYIAGCVAAGCIIKTQGFEEERLMTLMLSNNDVQLLGYFDISN